MLSQPSSFKSNSHWSGNRASVPVNCNRLKWSLISTRGNSQPLPVPPQCCCWGFSCTRAGGATRGWRREYITCLRTMTAGRTSERTCSTTTRRAAGRRIRWVCDFCFKIDFRSQVRESSRGPSSQSYYDNLHRLSWRLLQRGALVSLSLWQPLTFKNCSLMLMTSGFTECRGKAWQLILLKMCLFCFEKHSEQEVSACSSGLSEVCGCRCVAGPFILISCVKSVTWLSDA